MTWAGDPDIPVQLSDRGFIYVYVYGGGGGRYAVNETSERRAGVTEWIRGS